jgi:hypothetical protein
MEIADWFWAHHIGCQENCATKKTAEVGAFFSQTLIHRGLSDLKRPGLSGQGCSDRKEGWEELLAGTPPGW